MTSLRVRLYVTKLSFLSKKALRSTVKLYAGIDIRDTIPFLDLTVQPVKTAADRHVIDAIYRAERTAAACFGGGCQVLDNASAGEPTKENSEAVVVSSKTAIKLVTAWMIAEIRSTKGSRSSGGVDVYTQFETTLHSHVKSAQSLVSAYLQIDAVATVLFCGGSGRYQLYPGLHSPETPAGAAASAGSKSDGLKSLSERPPSRGKMFRGDGARSPYGGEVHREKILVIQVPLRSIQQEKLVVALSRRKRSKAFYFRAKDSESLLQKRVAKAVRQAEKQSASRATGVVTIAIEVGAGVPSLDVIQELTVAGCFKQGVDRIEHGFHSGSMVATVRFIEVEAFGPKSRPMYRRLDTRNTVDRIPGAVAVCNAIL